MTYVDSDRMDRVRRAMAAAGLDAFLCSSPQYVLMLSQYWPVLASSLVVVTAEAVALLVPEDEQELAERSSADMVRSFITASLERVTTAEDEVFPVLRKLCAQLGGLRGKVGVEMSGHFMPPAYISVHRYGASLLDRLGTALPDVSLVAVDDLLNKLSAVKTSFELNMMRQACLVASQAFTKGRAALAPGMTEREAAQCFQPRLLVPSQVGNDVRCGGQVWCMSGPNSAQAYFGYAQTRERTLQTGDLVLIHCNSHYNGMWTDITRTFLLADAPTRKEQELYSAVFQARSAALAAVRPGVAAKQVDRAARAVMLSAGFGDAFKHQTGHGVGFSAIDHNSYPRIHPSSSDTLEEGMTFNVEPAIYIDGFGGLRHCDLVAVGADGPELLTPFISSPAALTLNNTGLYSQQKRGGYETLTTDRPG